MTDRQTDRIECITMLMLILTFSVQMGGVTPLHIATELNSKQGVMMVEMLLDCLANTDIRALDDGSYLQWNPVFPSVSLTS